MSKSLKKNIKYLHETQILFLISAFNKKSELICSFCTTGFNAI